MRTIWTYVSLQNRSRRNARAALRILVLGRREREAAEVAAAELEGPAATAEQRDDPHGIT